MKITKQYLAELYCGVIAQNPEYMAEFKKLCTHLAKPPVVGPSGRIRWGFAFMDVGEIRVIPYAESNKCRIALHNWLRTVQEPKPEFKFTRLSAEGDYRLERTK